MFDVNLTLVIFVGMFLGFMALLNEMVLKPVGKVLEQRKAIIRDNIDAAASARAKSPVKPFASPILEPQGAVEVAVRGVPAGSR